MHVCYYCFRLFTSHCVSISFCSLKKSVHLVKNNSFSNKLKTTITEDLYALQQAVNIHQMKVRLHKLPCISSFFDISSKHQFLLILFTTFERLSHCQSIHFSLFPSSIFLLFPLHSLS